MFFFSKIGENRDGWTFFCRIETDVSKYVMTAIGQAPPVYIPPPAHFVTGKAQICQTFVHHFLRFPAGECPDNVAQRDPAPVIGGQAK